MGCGGKFESMSKRLEILKASLIKKEAALDAKFTAHFADVKRANGQPLNDKRNGHVTLNRWEKQGDSIRKAQAEIQKTKDAIEFEEDRISGCETIRGVLPSEILELLESGKITQWRKHPNRFFVVGVDRARLVWDSKLQKVLHSHVAEIPKGTGQFDIFKDVFNHLNNTVNKR